MMDDLPFHTVPIPPRRAVVIDAGYLGNKRHIGYGLVSADVTRAQALRRGMTKRVSFTAYLVACLAHAIAQDPSVQAYRQGNQLVIFSDVDVVTMIEPAKDAVAIPHVIRNANRRSVRNISDEIAQVKAQPKASPQEASKMLQIGARLPRWMRMLFWWWLHRNAHRRRKWEGTVVLTSVGMFGKGHGGWGLSFLPCHTLGLTVGGVSTRPAVIQDEIVAREFVDLTIAIDHDIVDGAPAARFANRLIEIIESAELMREEDGEEQDATETEEQEHE